MNPSRAPLPFGAAVRTIACLALALTLLTACRGAKSPAATSIPSPAPPAAMTEPSASFAAQPPSDVVVYAVDLPASALYELEIWDDPASPGGRMIGLTNTGDELDPPPENDPHALFEIQVQADVPYRCWLHMKVGAAKGVSQANVIWVQFTGAVDKSGGVTLRPGTGSYLTAAGETAQGWSWVGCSGQEDADALVHFGVSGTTKVCLQAGMEGVGFDQFILSPNRFLKEPPSDSVVEK